MCEANQLWSSLFIGGTANKLHWSRGNARPIRRYRKLRGRKPGVVNRLNFKVVGPKGCGDVILNAERRTCKMKGGSQGAPPGTTIFGLRDQNILPGLAKDFAGPALAPKLEVGEGRTWSESILLDERNRFRPCPTFSRSCPGDKK